MFACMGCKYVVCTLVTNTKINISTIVLISSTKFSRKKYVVPDSVIDYEGYEEFPDELFLSALGAAAFKPILSTLFVLNLEGLYYEG